MRCLRFRLLHRRRRRRARSPAVNTPLEDDDLLGEILLRLPPQPSSLPRASLVCKRWRSLASGPGFLRRFRRHHCRNPPLLGFFFREDVLFVPTLEAPNCVPPGCFPFQPGDGDRFINLGCRHGLVLIFNITPNEMLVWDPITGDQHRLAIPPGIAEHGEKSLMNGSVLRPAREVDDHFQVVLTVGDDFDKQHRRVYACVYSSETGLWGDLISTPPSSEVPNGSPTMVMHRAVLAGNSLYWKTTGNAVGILQFDLEKQSLAVIQAPVHMLAGGYFSVMRADDGGFGLLSRADSSIQLWKMTIDSDGVALWGFRRTIELAKVLSLEPRHISQSLTIVCLAEENNVLFLWTCGSVFMVHLDSLQFKKLYETNCLQHHHPFESVYTAGIGGGHDAGDVLQHT